MMECEWKSWNIMSLFFDREDMEANQNTHQLETRFFFKKKVHLRFVQNVMSLTRCELFYETDASTWGNWTNVLMTVD